MLNAVNEETLVKVIRNGRIQEIPRKDVVVGDIVVLETGEEIPADGELIEAISLQVNESNLTGEPVINKTTVEADFLCGICDGSTAWLAADHLSPPCRLFQIYVYRVGCNQYSCGSGDCKPKDQSLV